MIKFQLDDKHFIKPEDARNWVFVKTHISKKTGKEYEEILGNHPTLEQCWNSTIDEYILLASIKAETVAEVLQVIERLKELRVGVILKSKTLKA
jgi:hypothetical protein